MVLRELDVVMLWFAGSCTVDVVFVTVVGGLADIIIDVIATEGSDVVDVDVELITEAFSDSSVETDVVSDVDCVAMAELLYSVV